MAQGIRVHTSLIEDQKTVPSTREHDSYLAVSGALSWTPEAPALTWTNTHTLRNTNSNVNRWLEMIMETIQCQPLTSTCTHKHIHTQNIFHLYLQDTESPQMK